MATYTENYNLTMPEESDYYNVEDYNENFETIDVLMAENEKATAEINKKIGTPDAGETVFSLLKNSNVSFIKSIQMVSASHGTSSEKETVLAIETVDPNRCIVIMDRMYDSTNLSVSVNYILTETTLTVKTGSSSVGSIKLQFQIIEFN